MKRQISTVLLLSVLTLAVFQACGDATDSSESTVDGFLHEENVSYSADTVTMNGLIVYSNGDNAERRPAVLVVHEWWGQTDYVRSRARQLAELGYVAMAVDLYGRGKTADDPAEAEQLATPFYANPQLGLLRMEAARQRLMSHPQVDTSKIAAIGYCFGGAMVLNAAKMGADLEGVVSFHGNLAGVVPQKDLVRADVLVCHGTADSLVPQAEVDQFKKQMDSVDAAYSFRAYEGAMHAFTNPNATEIGVKHNIPIAYNANADQESWNHMQDFLKKVFGQ